MVERALNNVREEREKLERTIAEQPMTPEELETMSQDYKHEMHVLQAVTGEATERHVRYDDMKRALSDKDLDVVCPALIELMREYQIDKRRAAYHKLAQALHLIPSTAAHAHNKDLRMRNVCDEASKDHLQTVIMVMCRMTLG